MRLDILNQVKRDVSFPLCPVHVLTGSALPVDVTGVPSRRAGADVVGVKLSVTNADGVVIEVPLEQYADNVWRGILGASNFATYGTVECGVVISLEFAEVGATHTEKIAVGDIEILKGSATAQPGDPTASYQTLGGDQYLKSEVIDGVQHYKRVEIAYDTDMEDWGFNLTGDYVLSGSSFVAV